MFYFNDASAKISDISTEELEKVNKFRKIETLDIIGSTEQISKVLLALSPVLASRGRAALGGAGFYLRDDFGDSFEERINLIIQVNPTNVVGFFKG